MFTCTTLSTKQHVKLRTTTTSECTNEMLGLVITKRKTNNTHISKCSEIGGKVVGVNKTIELGRLIIAMTDYLCQHNVSVSDKAWDSVRNTIIEWRIEAMKLK